VPDASPPPPLPEPRALTCVLRDREPVTPLVTRIVLGGDDLIGFEYVPGQDLMLAVPVDDGTMNRRYTVRRADPTKGTVDVDVVVHGDGPGARWAADAPLGSSITAVGPRGKVVPIADADWHLFVGDESGWAASAAMAESLAPGVAAVVVAEIAGPEERQDLDRSSADVEVVWCERDGRAPGVAQPLLDGVGGVALPAGVGHAYLSAEFAVVRALGDLLDGRGLDASRRSPKAYWRRGTANAPHGEPPRDG
jgi:NADPH-dependent ferric siderophore reductase